MILQAPLAGNLIPLSDVPDPVFAEEMMGPGVALMPTLGDSVSVGAPTGGVLIAVQPHAFIVKTDEGFGVLTHLGIDTVGAESLFTEALNSSAGLPWQKGDVVTAGDTIAYWNVEETKRRGLPIHVPVVVLELPAGSVLEPEMGPVQAGDPIIRVIPA